MISRWTILSIPTILFAGVLAYGFLPFAGDMAVDKRTSQLKPILYDAIPGWMEDDHAAAFAAFAISCARIVAVAEAGKGNGEPLADICKKALAAKEIDRDTARNFFESHFTPHRYEGGKISGFVTGYFEPELKGARTKSERFFVPVHAAPGDLVQLIGDDERAARNHEMTAVRDTPDGSVAYFDRKEIEQGALKGRGLEILYLESWADAFTMHIQGSGRVELAKGGHVRLGFAAKNGHSYTAIGKELIARGEIERDNMSMAAVRGWLDANPDDARALMWLNRSYIFFSELDSAKGASGPIGAQGVALTPLRSLAVDTSIHALGTPVWVNAPTLDVLGRSGFSKLMIAQDAGSAIKGNERGDIFFGSGNQAGALAGAVRHEAGFTMLLPNAATPGI